MENRGPALPAAPPFRLRARVLTPLGAGGIRWLADGLVHVDGSGRIAHVGPWREPAAGSGAGAPAGPAVGPVIDLRPWLLMPGLVDLHTHIPQFPNAGVGAGLDLLTWLERYTFPLERHFDRVAAERLAPHALRAFARAGTTTVVGYVTDDAEATEAVFEAAEAFGIRAVLGLVLMDRSPADDAGRHSAAAMRRGLSASTELCGRWHERDGGRLRYAFTPRFALSCSPGLLRESVRLAVETGAHWQTHLSEDPREIDAVRRVFPDARDYLDVYEQAGTLGPQMLFAHAIHLSRREVTRLAESGAAVAHCPSSNLFLPSGVMPLARYLEAGILVGLGSDLSGGPDPSILDVMRVGAYAQHARQALGQDRRETLDPLAWLRLGTLEGARALGLGERIGSIEAGREADLIAVDPSLADPVPGAGEHDKPIEMVSRLVFRTHPDMVRGAWVRGRLLPVA
jgi:guanine deaminase